jgi:hypothetical protein
MVGGRTAFVRGIGVSSIGPPNFKSIGVSVLDTGVEV